MARSAAGARPATRRVRAHHMPAELAAGVGVVGIAPVTDGELLVRGQGGVDDVHQLAAEFP